MSNNNETNRHLYLGTEVKESSVNPLIEKIIEINKEDDRNEKTVMNYDRTSKPIILTVNTVGGYVTCGLALIDIMLTSKTPVHTVGLGIVASMGVPIVLAGSKRFSHEHTLFMIHDMSYGMAGTAEQHERRLEVNKKFYRDRITKFILDRTNIRKDDIVDTNEAIKDWYFDSDEAIKLGVVDNKLVMHRIKYEDAKAGNFVID